MEVVTIGEYRRKHIPEYNLIHCIYKKSIITSYSIFNTIVFKLGKKDDTTESSGFCLVAEDRLRTAAKRLHLTCSTTAGDNGCEALLPILATVSVEGATYSNLPSFTPKQASKSVPLSL